MFLSLHLRVSLQLKALNNCRLLVYNVSEHGVIWFRVKLACPWFVPQFVEISDRLLNSLLQCKLLFDRHSSHEIITPPPPPTSYCQALTLNVSKVLDIAICRKFPAVQTSFNWRDEPWVQNQILFYPVTLWIHKIVLCFCWPSSFVFFISDFFSSRQARKYSGDTTNSFDAKDTIRGPNGMFSHALCVGGLESVLFIKSSQCFNNFGKHDVFRYSRSSGED